MSEKRLIIIGALGIFLLATVLMYLMLNHDYIKQNKTAAVENVPNSQITNVPKIEIGISK
jgi:uncharacterized membrane protein